MALIAASISSATVGANQLKTLLTGNSFDVKTAKSIAKRLYQDGIQFVQGELANHPPEGEAISVVTALAEVVSLPSIQLNFSLHKALSKAYRIFIELTWHRCFEQKLKVFSDTRKILIENSEKLIANLPADRQAVKFEYECAKQAAKVLTPAQGFWEKYITIGLSMAHGVKTGDTGAVSSIPGVLLGFKELLKSAGSDWVEGWYPDIYALRWSSTRVKTPDDFNKILVPQFNTYREKGEEYTLCFAVIFRELAKSDGELRSVAIGHLIQLLTLEDNESLPKLCMELSLVQKIAKKIDIYWETRSLTILYLGKLGQKPKYSLYRHQMIEALESLSRKTKYSKEQTQVHQTAQEIRKQLNTLAVTVIEKEDELSTIVIPSQGGDQDKQRAQQLKNELDGMQSEQKMLEGQIKDLNDLSSDLKNKEKEEKELIEAALKSLKP